MMIYDRRKLPRKPTVTWDYAAPVAEEKHRFMDRKNQTGTLVSSGASFQDHRMKKPLGESS